MSSNMRPKRMKPQVSSGFFSRVRNNFLTGIVVVAPFAITLYLTLTVIEYVDETVIPRVKPFVPEAYWPENLLPEWFPQMGIGVVILALFLIFVGSFTKNFFGRELLKLGERWVERMPFVRTVYNGLKQITETMFQQSASSFDRACLVEYPRRGLWAVAFVSGEASGEIPKKVGDTELMSVFLPTTPNPTSGFLLYVPKEDVVLLDMSFEEAAKLVISFGLVTPDDLDKNQVVQAAETEGFTAPPASELTNKTVEAKSPAQAGARAARNPISAITATAAPSTRDAPRNVD